jgi:hypothetical protein
MQLVPHSTSSPGPGMPSTCTGVLQPHVKPAHEERGNGERATVGGADGGGKKTEEALTGG